MSEMGERILKELEEVTGRLAAPAELSLDDLAGLVERRGELVSAWERCQPDCEDVPKRLGAIVREGAEAESRLRAMRASLRQESGYNRQLLRFAEDIRGMVVFPPHSLNVEA